MSEFERGEQIRGQEAPRVELDEELTGVLIGQINRLMEEASELSGEDAKEKYLLVSKVSGFLGDPESAANQEAIAGQPITAAAAHEQPRPTERPSRRAPAAEPTQKKSMFEKFRGSKLGFATAVGAAAIGGFFANAVLGGGSDKAPNKGPEIAKADGDSASAATSDKKKEQAKVSGSVKYTKTVPQAVEKLHSPGEKALKANMKRAISGNFGEKKLIHDNGGGNDQMNSLYTRFKPGEINARDGAEAVAFGIGGSDAYAAANYNALKGNHVDEDLPAGVSVEEARNILKNQMTSEDANIFVTDQKSGLYMNHGQDGENVFDSGLVDITGKKVLVIKTESGKQLVYKVFENGCINLLTPVKAKITIPTAQPTTQTVSRVTPQQPGPGGITPNPSEPKQPKQPQQPKQPKQPEKKEEEKESAGKDHTKSPVTDDRNHPNEVVRPNIPAPDKAIQPVGAPETDPYTPPETVTPPEGVGPTEEEPADETPTTGEDTDGELKVSP